MKGHLKMTEDAVLPFSMQDKINNAVIVSRGATAAQEEEMARPASC